MSLDLGATFDSLNEPETIRPQMLAPRPICAPLRPRVRRRWRGRLRTPRAARGQPNVAAPIKKYAGVKGDLDHDRALAFLSGLLGILRGSGHRGLVGSRARRSRDLAAHAIRRQLIDEIGAGRFPGLYLLITGTGSFFDGPQGMQRLTPLAQSAYVFRDRRALR